MMTFSDLFTARQKLAWASFSLLIGAFPDGGAKDLLAMAESHVVTRNSSLCLWRYHADQEKVEHIFGRQTLSVVWDFAEAVPISDVTGSFEDGIAGVTLAAGVIRESMAETGQVSIADACAVPLPDETASVWFTDPPYYDAIPYSDLADLFFVWLKRALPDSPVLFDPFDSRNSLTPKLQEIVQDEMRTAFGHVKDRVFFETRMAQAFREGRRILGPGGVASVVFAHKTTEGWEHCYPE